MSMTLAILASAAACAAPTDAGDAGAQYIAYAERSLEIVRAASTGNADKLAYIVSEDADFRLGAGDVGIPLGAGIEGALAFGKRLNAHSYSYPGWDYMSYPQDACLTTEVELRFMDGARSFSSTVKFTYSRGLLVSAHGWTNSLNTGLMNEDQTNG